MKNTGLGRGLGALLGDTAVRSPENGTVELRVSEVEPNREQPRKAFDEGSLAELAENIAQNGVLSPLWVRRLPSGSYQIIAGERRWRAARMAGLTNVPVRVFDADDRRATELSLIENLQREDLNPIEVAEGYQTLIDTFDLTQEEISKEVGRSRPAIANSLRLLLLPAPVLDMVREGRLSGGHARALLPLTGMKTVTKAAAQMADGALNVRQSEALVKKLTALPKATKEKPLRYVGDYERNLTLKYGRKVTIGLGKVRGRVEFEYYSGHDLETLYNMLMKVSEDC